MPKISVLIPVYNVEKYLKKCLDSVINQTLEDIEIICVDDGSSDGSGAILDYYAEKDSRIVVLHKKNAGYGATMNAGLDIASGDYIGIVESDDYVMPEMYEVLYEKASNQKLDFVKSDACYWYEKINYIRRIHMSNLDDMYNRVLTDIDRNLFFEFFMNIWTGIYSKNFLTQNDIRFNESPGAAYQDNAFWMQTMFYANRAMWIDEAFYYYRQDNPMASVKSIDKVMAMTKEYEYLEELLRSRGQDCFLPYCYYYKLFRHKGTYYRISDDNKLAFCEQIKQDYNKYKAYIRGNKFYDTWLHNICVNSDEITKKVISIKSFCRDKLSNAKSIVIYGIGNRGDMVLRTLYNEGLYHKITCCAITNALDEQHFAGKSVLSIHDAINNNKDALYIIAVARGSAVYNQMKNELYELGVDNTLDGFDIEENYYIL